MRSIVKEYAKKQQKLIEKAKKSSEGIFKGVSAKDLLDDPASFSQFMVQKAFIRFKEYVATPASELGFLLADALDNATKKDIKESLKLGSTTKKTTDRDR